MVHQVAMFIPFTLPLWVALQPIERQLQTIARCRRVFDFHTNHVSTMNYEASVCHDCHFIFVDLFGCCPRNICITCFRECLFREDQRGEAEALAYQAEAALSKLNTEASVGVRAQPHWWFCQELLCTGVPFFSVTTQLAACAKMSSKEKVEKWWTSPLLPLLIMQGEQPSHSRSSSSSWRGGQPSCVKFDTSLENA